MGQVLAQYSRIGDEGAFDRPPVVEILQLEQGIDQYAGEEEDANAIDEGPREAGDRGDGQRPYGTSGDRSYPCRLPAAVRAAGEPSLEAFVGALLGYG